MMLDVQADLDQLYQVPLASFVSARNALASRLKAAGETEGAARVKSLAKPSASAWAVNQVYWKERGKFEALIAAGDALRATEKAKIGGDVSHGVEAARQTRQAALDAVLRTAESLLSGGGATVLLRVATTCEALAAYGSSRPFDGRLTTDLDPPGLSALAGLAPARAAEPSRHPVDPMEMARLRAELARAGQEVAKRRAELEDARRRLTEVTVALTQAEEALSEARRAVAKLE